MTRGRLAKCSFLDGYKTKMLHSQNSFLNIDAVVYFRASFSHNVREILEVKLTQLCMHAFI